MRQQIRQTSNVRTGKQYGGIVNRNSQPTDSYYNDEYYASGTTFDRVGRRLNNSNLGGRSTQYEQDRGYARSNSQGYYDDRSRNAEVSRKGSPAFDDVSRAEQQRAQRVNSIEYNSAILSGRYHNLDDPRNDVRDFGEEETAAEEVTDQNEE